MIGRMSGGSRSSLSRLTTARTGLTLASSERFTSSNSGGRMPTEPSNRSRGLSAPPRLTDQQDNLLARLPPPLVKDASSVLISPPRLRSDELPTPRDAVVVYTDGSCRGNYASGAGIYFGENHPLNLSQPLPGPIHTSVYAEMQAALLALERLHGSKDYSGQKVILRTDCKAVIDGLRRGGGFANENYNQAISRIRLAAQRFGSGVLFQHVYGHNGQRGNEAADRLATMATAQTGRARSATVNRRSRSRSVSRNGRGVPNAEIFVPPKKEDPSLVIPPPSASQRASTAKTVNSERQSRSRSKSHNRSKSRSARSQRTVTAEATAGEHRNRSSSTRRNRSKSRSAKTQQTVTAEAKVEERQSRSRSVKPQRQTTQSRTPLPRSQHSRSASANRQRNRSVSLNRQNSRNGSAAPQVIQSRTPLPRSQHSRNASASHQRSISVNRQNSRNMSTTRTPSARRR